MNLRTALSALAICGSALVHPLNAAAAAASPIASPLGPITINSCDIKKVNSAYGMGNLSLAVGKGYNFFTIAFTNNGAVAADDITFQVDFNASRILIGDVGSYAPGVTTTHTLRDKGKSVVASARPGGNGPTVCSVASAHFTDGTTWAAPAPAAMNAP